MAQASGFESKPLDGFESRPLEDESKTVTPARVKEARERIAKAKENQPVRDVLIGIGKRAGKTVTNIGGAVRKIPGVSMLDRLMSPYEYSSTTDNAAQALGATGEQIAEFFMPLGLVGKAETALVGVLPKAIAGSKWALALARSIPEAASAGAVAKAQGDSNAKTSAVVAGATGAVGPLSAGLGPKIQKVAQRQVGRAFDASSPRMVALAKKIAPDLLSGRFGRVVGLTMDGVAERARLVATTVGEGIEDQIKQYGHLNFGDTIDGIVKHLEGAKDAYRVVVTGDDAFGMTGDIATHAILFDPRKVVQLSRTQRILEQLRDTGAGTLENLVGLRRAWDEVVASVGGFAERGSSGTRAASADLKQRAEGWAKREGVRAIRQVLSDPQFTDLKKLHALNAQYSFWTNIQDLAEGAVAKSNDQAGRVIKALGAVGGAIVGEQIGQRQMGTGGGVAGATFGAMAGAAGSASIGGALGKQIVSASRSPAFRLASAKIKNDLAEAIMHGRVEQAMRILGKFSAGAVAGAPDTSKP